MIKQFVKKLIQYYIDLIVSWYRKIKTYYNLNSEIKKYHEIFDKPKNLKLKRQGNLETKIGRYQQEIQMNKRIPRKKGQPAKSDKHSDLYTDEDPKGTIKGLQFKNKRAAALSVAKIKRSNRSHAHKNSSCYSYGTASQGRKEN